MPESRKYQISSLGGNELYESVGPGYQQLLPYFLKAADQEIKNPNEYFDLGRLTKTLQWGFPKSSVESIKNFYENLMDVLLVKSIQIVKEEKNVPIARFHCAEGTYGGVKVEVDMDFLENPNIVTNSINVEMHQPSRKNVSKLVKELSDYLESFGIEKGISQDGSGKYSVSISVPLKPKRQSSFMGNVHYTHLESLMNPDLYYLDQLVNAVWASAEALARIKWRLDPNRQILDL